MRFGDFDGRAKIRIVVIYRPILLVQFHPLRLVINKR